MSIKQVAVIGSGVMGSGIAAHIANAGVPVLLLDIVLPDQKDRNFLANSAIQRMLKTEPAAFMHKRNARLVTAGNIEDDLDKISGCDWIIEAVKEDPQIKQALYQKIAKIKKPNAVVSSNTSTIPIQYLTKGLDDQFCSTFLITHFFNPPRYMRLLEIVAGEKTHPEVVKGIALFCDKALGKGVVHCHDTPGFIANRIGTFWILTAVKEAMKQDLTVEEADLVMSRPLGIPKTGVFGLVDLVGLDLMPLIVKSMMMTLPQNDRFRSTYEESELINKMIAEGYTGRKGKGGFYRLNRENGKKVKESINLQTGEYAPSIRANVSSVKKAGRNPQALMQLNDKYGKYAWSVMSQTLSYAAELVPEIADDIVSVDEAMKLGYNWKFGPFELLDKITTQNFVSRLESEGKAVPPFLEKAKGKSFYKFENGKPQFLSTTGSYEEIIRPDGVLKLSDIKQQVGKPVIKTPSACLWDIGDGVACFEFTSKMNSIDNTTFEALQKAIDVVSKQFKALVIYSEAQHFSAGANLGLALFVANVGMWSGIEDLISVGQQTYKKLKYAPFPVIGAPTGLALGGGTEILLHCDSVQAHAETYMGLVEVGVGIIPGWGGCKEMLIRGKTNKRMPNGPMPAVSKAFETISMAKVSKSAFEAKELMYLSETDNITMNKDRLLFDAKQRALELAKDYVAPEEIKISLPGDTGLAALKMAVDGFAKQGLATPHDQTVSGELAVVLTGGDTDFTEEISEDEILDLEKRHFMKLAKTKESMARMEHMLETGKPLRN